jgi:hypothetical protein
MSGSKTQAQPTLSGTMTSPSHAHAENAHGDSALSTENGNVSKAGETKTSSKTSAAVTAIQAHARRKSAMKIATKMRGQANPNSEVTGASATYMLLTCSDAQNMASHKDKTYFRVQYGHQRLRSKPVKDIREMTHTYIVDCTEEYAHDQKVKISVHLQKTAGMDPCIGRNVVLVPGNLKRCQLYHVWLPLDHTEYYVRHFDTDLDMLDKDGDGDISLDEVGKYSAESQLRGILPPGGSAKALHFQCCVVNLQWLKLDRAEMRKLKNDLKDAEAAREVALNERDEARGKLAPLQQKVAKLEAELSQARLDLLEAQRLEHAFEHENSVLTGQVEALKERSTGRTNQLMRLLHSLPTAALPEQHDASDVPAGPGVSPIKSEKRGPTATPDLVQQAIDVEAEKRAMLRAGRRLHSPIRGDGIRHVARAAQQEQDAEDGRRHWPGTYYGFA